jgi:uncharacterized protein
LDLGVRNAVIDNFDQIENRSDKGSVFENFVFLELLKNGNQEDFAPQIYFWRTDTKQEIDFIEYKNGKINATECKWKKEQIAFTSFLKLYKEANVTVVSVSDFVD